MDVERFHHVAVGVTKLSDAVSFWKQVFGAKLISQDYNDLEKRNAAFLSLGGTIVEIFEPTNETGDTAKFLQRRGQGIHSIAFKVKDAEQVAKDLKARGLRVIGPRVAPCGDEMTAYYFIHPKDAFGVLIEFADYHWRDKIDPQEPHPRRARASRH